MDKIYLDTNVLTALLAEDENSEKYKVVNSALAVLTQELGVELCVSPWCLTEMVKVLVNEYRMQPKAAAKIHNEIRKTSKLGGYDVALIPTSPKGDYSIDDFFIEVGEVMTNYNPGWGDAFHCVIMKQNSITTILSRDEKDDFEIVPTITLVHPKSITPTE